MSYRVIWSREAEDDLAVVWLEAADRNAVTRAATVIDRALEFDPLAIGESRQDDQRIAFQPPLVVIYAVSQKLRTVWVVNVRLMRQRG